MKILLYIINILWNWWYIIKKITSYIGKTKGVQRESKIGYGILWCNLKRLGVYYFHNWDLGEIRRWEWREKIGGVWIKYHFPSFTSRQEGRKPRCPMLWCTNPPNFSPKFLHFGFHFFELPPPRSQQLHGSQILSNHHFCCHPIIELVAIWPAVQPLDCLLAIFLHWGFFKPLPPTAHYVFLDDPLAQRRESRGTVLHHQPFGFSPLLPPLSWSCSLSSHPCCSFHRNPSRELQFSSSI